MHIFSQCQQHNTAAVLTTSPHTGKVKPHWKDGWILAAGRGDNMCACMCGVVEEHKYYCAVYRLNVFKTTPAAAGKWRVLIM